MKPNNSILTLFEQPEPTGKELKEIGMRKAEQTANAMVECWSDKAFEFLKSYAGYTSGEFMAEDVRLASIHALPEPPSKRAWGSVIARAKRAGIIKCVGIKQVKNPTAHSANASVWKKAA